MAAPTLDLEPGEEVLAHIRASFRGAATASSRATFLLGSARVRHNAFEEWRRAADAAEFPTAGPEMVLALTDRRLFVCSTTFWLSRPAESAGAIHLSHIAGTAVVRHGLVTGLALLLNSGAIIEFETMRAGAVRRFGNAIDAARAAHQG